MKDKKNLMVLVGIVALAIVIVVSIIIFGKISNESKKENEMKNLGKAFYEEVYYKQLVESDIEVKDFLSRFKENGIKFDLKTLVGYKDDNKELFDKCNLDDSKVTIYPSDPYKQDSYKMELTLSCE
jgi:hypothetical protein